MRPVSGTRGCGATRSGSGVWTIGMVRVDTESFTGGGAGAVWMTGAACVSGMLGAGVLICGVLMAGDGVEGGAALSKWGAGAGLGAGLGAAAGGGAGGGMELDELPLCCASAAAERIGVLRRTTERTVGNFTEHLLPNEQTEG